MVTVKFPADIHGNLKKLVIEAEVDKEKDAGRLKMVAWKKIIERIDPEHLILRSVGTYATGQGS